MSKVVVEFWSSVQMPAFLGSLVRELRTQGVDARECHHVTEDSYRAPTRVGTRTRSRFRFRTYVGYPLRLMLHAWRVRRPTFMVVSSNTFYAPWLVQQIRNPRVKVIHWVLDLYPDVLSNAGQLAQNGWAERQLSALIRDTFTRAAANIFLGHRLLQHAESRFGAIPKAHIVPIGAEGHSFLAPRDTPDTERSGSRRELRVLYCGNLGAMHEVETIAQLLGREIPDGVHMEFSGHGSGMTTLRAAVVGNASRIRFSDAQPQVEWREKMSLADVALVTIKPGAERLIMPSKAYSALRAGQALLAVCASDSDLAELIKQHSAGWVVAPGDTAGLRRLLHWLQSEPAEVLRCRRNAWRAGQEECDTQKIAKIWRGIFEEVATD